MATMLPRPTSAFSGPLLESWQLVRTGQLRHAAHRLAALPRDAPDDLDAPAWAEHAWLSLTCRLAGGDLSGASTAALRLEPSLAGGGLPAVLAHLGRADVAAATGDHEGALDHFLRAGAIDDAEDHALPPWRAGVALTFVRLGRRTEASDVASQLVTTSERSADPWHLAIALRTVAIVEPAADPLGTLQRARHLAHASGDRRLAAQVDADLAGALLLHVSDGLSAAVDLLRSAEAYAATEALWPLHGRVARLLARAGTRIAPLHDPALGLLTAGEQRVARLAARGLTNRKVADELAITVKAVEWHLSRAYRKLGISSREELAPLLGPVDRAGTASA